ncbi:DNA-3-methyladenine glycosylase I [Fructilactobacillus florum]|uniref:DNA-3-methyladenine glycosylase I n=1 Tax=Fructilactobacillus florum TaxID=640331 RepID=UPI00028F0ABF|nr:DNA-3-methyladenine glycosylase I [Fructilactobacillus florum]EKK21205.1 DNA-3-methyladenine glycosylase [Fructilactobacillus florum 2F]
MIRCSWVPTGDQMMQQYHDEEWGTPCHDRCRLFEILSLEIMQAGLSWNTVLAKRPAFREAFHDFEVTKVAQMQDQLPRLMTNAALIRNQRKLQAVITNAKIIAAGEQHGQNFAEVFWSVVGQHPLNHHCQTANDVPKTIPKAVEFSQKLKQAGFQFVGPVTIYSFFQAAGLVNDHENSCFRYQQLQMAR